MRGTAFAGGQVQGVPEQAPSGLGCSFCSVMHPTDAVWRPPCMLETVHVVSGPTCGSLPSSGHQEPVKSQQKQMKAGKARGYDR